MLVGWTKRSKGFAEPCSCNSDFMNLNGSGEEVECFYLDHFARKCPFPPFSRLLAEQLYKDATRIVRYGDLSAHELSVTLLPRDPLLVRLERDEPYVLDPLDDGLCYMLAGSFAHKGLLSTSPNVWTELPLRVQLGAETLYGTLDAVDFTGPPAIRDLKTQKIFSIDRKLKQSKEEILADVYVKDHIFQVNAYRWMFKEVTGVEVQTLWLEYWDSLLRTVRVEAPIVQFDRMGEEIKRRVTTMVHALTTQDLSTIPVSDGKHISIKKSGVYYKYLEIGK